MMNFFRNLKAATLLDKEIQKDRRELQMLRNNLFGDLDKYLYEDGNLLLGSFLGGFVASFFIKSSKLLKILSSSYLKVFRTFMRYLPKMI